MKVILNCKRITDFKKNKVKEYYKTFVSRNFKIIFEKFSPLEEFLRTDL